MCKFIIQQANVANSVIGHDFVKLVECQGQQRSQTKAKQGQTTCKQGKHGSYRFDTVVETEKPKVCRYCWGYCKHLEDCSKFKDLSAGDRTNFARRNHLCNNCFIYKHIEKDCRKDGKYTKNGCNKKHNTACVVHK